MRLIIILFLMIEPGIVFGQTLEFKHNYTTFDSTQNPLDSFAKNYNFVIAYTEQSYWWPKTINYRILAHSDNKWACWTYSNNIVTWTKKKKSTKVVVDTILSGQFFKGKTQPRNENVETLIADLNKFDFWTLSNDSLNQTRVIEAIVVDGDTMNRVASIFDGVNYRFELLSKTASRVIKSYEPEYFVMRFPEMIDRKKFIESKNAFCCGGRNTANNILGRTATNYQL